MMNCCGVSIPALQQDEIHVHRIRLNQVSSRAPRRVMIAQAVSQKMAVVDLEP